MGRFRECERTLERFMCCRLVTHEPVAHSDLAHQEAEPPLVAELSGEAFGLLGDRERALQLAELVDGEPELDSDIHRDLERLPRVREVSERRERLLQMRHSLAKRKSCHRL